MIHRIRPPAYVPQFLAATLSVLLLMNSTTAQTNEQPAPRRWAIALHGGAGSLPKPSGELGDEPIGRPLREALQAGARILSSGGSALDAAEAAVVVLEDDPQFNAGKGAVFTRAGTHELDASIMDGATLRFGGVALVKYQKNPIKVARLVMERTPHVLLAGEGAHDFARESGLERVSQEYFYTDVRFRSLQTALANIGQPPLDGPAYPVPDDPRDDMPVEGEARQTVGCVALDAAGNLAAATSTGGLTAKMPGRVGDTPICGAGTYANNATCAVSGTGIGEQFIRHTIAVRVSMLMEHRGLTVDDAARHCLTEILNPGDGGIIAVDRTGRVSMRATTRAMPRGIADSAGRFEIALAIDE